MREAPEAVAALLLGEGGAHAAGPVAGERRAE
jgi:hypothetical protein